MVNGIPSYFIVIYVGMILIFGLLVLVEEDESKRKIFPFKNRFRRLMYILGLFIGISVLYVVLYFLYKIINISFDKRYWTENLN